MNDNKKKIKKKRKLRKGFIAALLTVIMATFVILLTTVLLPINSITMQYSGKKYTKEEIMAVARVKKGDNIIMTLESTVNKRVSEGLPYIGSVEVEKELPDKINLVVKETKATYTIKQNKKYVALDENFKVLEITDKKNRKLTYIQGLKLKENELGKPAVFKDQSAFLNVKEIMASVKKSGNSINHIDAKSQFDVKFAVNGKYNVEIGTTNDLTEKLSFMNKMIEQIEKKHKEDKGTINLRYFSEKKEGYFTRGEDKETFE